ncbi:Mannose-6-phosphate isomerase, class I [Flaviramulus basaltis]|uniref:Mannose-6-phosphate isomerase, class I n=1 Tax=Flaviramulus basaltis TaxID=369401 RepID=A0A1K2IM85_9FLAO|nr:class I mannose-6-phosphate isomerase [Flaviramulus basaltis]SFZ93553.1 Mannose-6-phosphate isomerase, class I [Flaviramulus basaltis]
MNNKFNKYPSVKIPSEYKCYSNWGNISNKIRNELTKIKKCKKIVVLDFYHGVAEDEINNELIRALKPKLIIESKDAFLSENEISEMIKQDVTDDRIFGYMTRLSLDKYFNQNRIERIKEVINNVEEGLIVVSGIGSSIVTDECDLLIYLDMARWEIQLRMRQQEVNNIGVNNKETDYSLLYKQGYFVDWRICDKHKKKLMAKWNYVIDTNKKMQPKMISGKTYIESLTLTYNKPFSLVPFFDPGVWGGQWMKKVCGLDKEKQNYAWCFNCVPEENSLFLQFENDVFETPSINLVFCNPVKLLGEAVYGRFGDEFPIRFDFLDTVEGGNLSLQVHPVTEYIQEYFGVNYTQDESYYMLDADENAKVYLGTKESISKEKMWNNLKLTQKEGLPFDVDNYVESWPAKKHDHFLIPAGTIHCSGKGSMVLEISATPYIFTFKLWDWDRLGMDGKPRPINLEHGKNVIDWSRTSSWVKENLINQIVKVDEGDGWVEERTGLHEREFIETRRHWFNKTVPHNTEGNLNVLCLIEGSQAIVESPVNEFEPFIVNYAETFIVPANIRAYTISPFGEGIGKRLGTIKAFVRT